MKKRITYLITLACAAVSCDSFRIDGPVQYGELSVSMGGEPTVDVVTKAGTPLSPTEPDAEKYTVRIFNSENAQQGDDKKFNEFTSPVKLPLGDYYVTAENCSESEAEAGYGQMRIAGSSGTVTLSAASLSQEASVNCSVTNARVAVKFDSSVEGRITDLKVVLTGGTTEGRSITVDKTEAGVVTETWFNPSTLSYSITGMFSAGGITKDVNISGKKELKAKNNVQIEVKVDLTNGQLIPNITIDKTIDSQTTDLSGKFNPYE